MCLLVVGKQETFEMLEVRLPSKVPKPYLPHTAAELQYLQPDHHHTKWPEILPSSMVYSAVRKKF